MDEEYYEKEKIIVNVEYEIRYKKGVEDARNEALRAAVTDLPFDLLGHKDCGGYGVRRLRSYLPSDS